MTTGYQNLLLADAAMMLAYGEVVRGHRTVDDGLESYREFMRLLSEISWHGFLIENSTNKFLYD